MNRKELYLAEITEITDPRYVGFLKLIERSFPVYELMPPSFWVRLLQKGNKRTERKDVGEDQEEEPPRLFVALRSEPAKANSDSESSAEDKREGEAEEKSGEHDQGGDKVEEVGEQEKSDPIVGLMMYETVPHSGYAYLWYIAVAPEKRGQGIGGWMLYQLEQQVRGERPQNGETENTTLQAEVIETEQSEQTGGEIRAILFEIEHRDHAKDDDHALQIMARERFYQRWGAKIARNVEYLQSVGNWQPSTPMYLCVYPLVKSLTDGEIRAMLAEAFPQGDGGGIQHLPDTLVLE